MCPLYASAFHNNHSEGGHYQNWFPLVADETVSPYFLGWRLIQHEPSGLSYICFRVLIQERKTLKKKKSNKDSQQFSALVLRKTLLRYFENSGTWMGRLGIGQKPPGERSPWISCLKRAYSPVRVIDSLWFIVLSIAGALVFGGDSCWVLVVGATGSLWWCWFFGHHWQKSTLTCTSFGDKVDQ